jgi:hypothetical protein
MMPAKILPPPAAASLPPSSAKALPDKPRVSGKEFSKSLEAARTFKPKQDARRTTGAKSPSARQAAPTQAKEAGKEAHEETADSATKKPVVQAKADRASQSPGSDKDPSAQAEIAGESAAGADAEAAQAGQLPTNPKEEAQQQTLDQQEGQETEQQQAQSTPVQKQTTTARGKKKDAKEAIIAEDQEKRDAQDLGLNHANIPAALPEEVLAAKPQKKDEPVDPADEKAKPRQDDGDAVVVPPSLIPAASPIRADGASSPQIPTQLRAVVLNESLEEPNSAETSGPESTIRAGAGLSPLADLGPAVDGDDPAAFKGALEKLMGTDRPQADKAIDRGSAGVAGVTDVADQKPHVARAESLAQPAATPAHFAEENHSNIVAGIRSQLLPGGGTMRIRLDPPELGALLVKVEMRDGALSASFQTSNDDATRLLSHSLTQLKQTLESAGVSVEKLQVQQAPKEHFSGQGHEGSGDQRQAQDQSARQEQERRETMQRLWRRLRDGSDPVDMMA